MSNVAGISGSNYYSQIASGTKLQSAADGASELAIAEKEISQINGYNVGERNAEDGKSALNVADGAMSGVADSLQRIRELAVQASNTAVMSDTDRQAIQYEIDQLKQGISDIANNTEFNTKKLLDGSNDNMHIASNADGSGHDLDTGNLTLESLGIQDFDVTKDFSIKTIDDALDKLSSQRSSIGAQSNALDFTIGYNTQTSYNLTAATSRMKDTDIAKAVSESDKQNLLQTYRFIMQKRQQDDERRKLSIFYM